MKPQLTEYQTLMHYLRRIPKRATVEQIRSGFKEMAEPIVQGLTSKGYLELRNGFYYPTEAGKRALAAMEKR